MSLLVPAVGAGRVAVIMPNVTVRRAVVAAVVAGLIVVGTVAVAAALAAAAVAAENEAAGVNHLVLTQPWRVSA